MPHISECLMKRSLKPTDLRDMTLGQLQVIVNDLHSQIESEHKTHTVTDLFLELAEMSNRAYGEKTRSCILTPTLCSGCESTFIHVRHFKGLRLFTASPERLLLPQCTDHCSCHLGMNNISFYWKRLQESPWVQKHELVFTYKRLSPHDLSVLLLIIVWRKKAKETIKETNETKTTCGLINNALYILLACFWEPRVGHLWQSDAALKK